MSDYGLNLTKIGLFLIMISEYDVLQLVVKFYEM